jgi:hypothetical protein
LQDTATTVGTPLAAISRAWASAPWRGRSNTTARGVRLLGGEWPAKEIAPFRVTG